MLDSALRRGNFDENRSGKGGTVPYRFENSLDRWLKRELDALYREVLTEPLPPELEELVRLCQAKLDEKDGNHGRNTR